MVDIRVVDQQITVIQHFCDTLNDITEDRYRVECDLPFVQIYRNNEPAYTQMRLPTAVRRLASRILYLLDIE